MMSIIIIVKDDPGVYDTLLGLKKIKKPEKTEILVVDASEGRLDHIKNKFPRVKWIYFYSKIDKATYPEQRNLGLKNARGDIIVFIDANCIPTPNWLIELTNPIKNEKEDIVAGYVKSKRGKSIHEISGDKNNNKRYLKECPTINMAFKKSIIHKIGYFDENLEAGEDLDFAWRAINAGYKIRYNQKAIINHDWGNLKQEIKRARRYAAAKVRLYRKHHKILRLFKYNEDLFVIYSIIYFLYVLSLIPITFFWRYYPVFLLIPIFKNLNKKIFTKLIFDFFWGFETLKELIFPKK